MNQVDLYAACPCGSGAKIKFCCCKDLAPDLGRVMRMIEGDQLKAAQDHLKRLLIKYPGRAALQALLCDVSFELDPNGEFPAAARGFVQSNPNNLAAMAWGAIGEMLAPQSPAEAAKESREALPSESAAEVKAALRRAAGLVQRALERLSDEGQGSPGEAANFPLLTAIEILIQLLFRTGEPLPAIAYQRLLVALVNGEQNAAEALRSVLANAAIPLFVRALPLLGGCSPEAPYVEEYATAKRLADVGAWQAALDRFRPLAASYPQQQELLKAVALLSSLTLDEGAVAAWRAYAAVPGLAEDDAVEAEAMAQYLAEAQSTRPHWIERTYAVTDANLLMERLLSDKRWFQIPVEQPDDQQPPPKGVFAILDRAPSSEEESPSLETVPRVLGRAELYGRETDQDARLVVTASASGGILERAAAVMVDVARELIGPQLSQQEEANRDTPSLAIDAGVPQLFLGAVAQREKLPELREAWFRQEVLPAWLDRPQPALTGESPRQAAQNPARRLPLLALLMNLRHGPAIAEASLLANHPPEPELGIAPPAPIDPATAGLQSLPAVRWSRLEVSKLSDDALAGMLNMASVLSEPEACRRLAAEVLARPVFQGKPIRAAALHMLAASHSPTSSEFLDYLLQARQALTEAGQSPLATYFTEMRIRLIRSEPEEFRALVEYVLKKWAHDREALNGLAQFLASMGLLRRGQAPTDAVAAPAAAAAPSASGLWTPGGESAAPVEGEAKSKLWVPGE